MAIRTGSGGLKYRLPSQADTNARQSAASASAGGSTTSSAFAANRRYSLGKRQIAHSALQSGLDRDFRAQQAFFGREHEKGAQLSAQEHRENLLDTRLASDAELEAQPQQFATAQNLQKGAAAQQAAAHKDALGIMGEETETDDPLDYDAAFKEGLRRRRENRLAGIQSGELEIPEQLQNQIRKTDAGLSEFGGLDSGQQQQFLEKRDALQEQGIQSATRRVGPNPTIDQEFRQATFKHNGIEYQKTDKGFVPLERPVDPQVEQQQQRQQQRSDLAGKLMTETTAEGQPKFSSYEAALEEAGSREQADRRFEGERIAGIQGQPQTAESHIDRARERLAGGRDRVTAGGQDFVAAAEAAGPAAGGYNADAPYEDISTVERQLHLRGESQHPGMDPETFGKYRPSTPEEPNTVGPNRTEALQGTTGPEGIYLQGHVPSTPERDNFKRTGRYKDVDPELLARAAKRTKSRGRRADASKRRAAGRKPLPGTPAEGSGAPASEPTMDGSYYKKLLGDLETTSGDISKIKDPARKRDAELLKRVLSNTGGPIHATAEEAKRMSQFLLPPGTEFVDPDGTIMRLK